MRANRFGTHRRAPRRTAAVALLAVAGLVAAACSGGDDGDGDGLGAGTGASGSSTVRVVTLPDLQLAASLTPFDSCDALLAWIRAEAAARVGPYGLPGTGWYGGPVALGDDVATAAGGPPGEPVPSAEGPAGADGSFSGTNVQVEGVDEPDIVKTDGDHVYALANGRFHVVDVADPANPVRVGTLTLDDAWGGELLAAGDTVLLLQHEVYALPLMERPLADFGFAPTTPSSTITQIDVSDPSAPRVVGRLALEGAYVSARLVDGVARIVVQSQPQLGMGFVAPASANPDAEARARAVNEDVVRASTLDDWVPSYVATDADGAVTGEGALLDCAQVHQPQQFSGFGMLSVLTVDLAEGLAGVDPGANAGIMSGGETVYASPEHLFVATQEWVDWEALTPEQQQTVDADYGTAIHRFDIASPDATRYEGSGRVPGRLLNQFSMDEHDGILRVATTEGSPWSADGQSQSSVRTLALDDGALVERGSVGGLGAGETIHAVRFLGDLGYVVTFRQTDPLHVVDLSDPAAPRLAGELEIPGYSAYLHPVGDGWLLGVGQDADETGAVLGSQVSLFDVRDPEHPARVAQAALGSGSSQVEWDHHAFLWWPADRFAMVPLETYDASPFSGAVGFTVDVDAGTITERGRVQHPAVTPAVQDQAGSSGAGVVGPDATQVVPLDATGATELEDTSVDTVVQPDGSTVVEPVPEPLPEPIVAPGYTPPIVRSLVVDGTLLTLSDAGLLASDLTTLAPGTWVDLTI